MIFSTWLFAAFLTATVLVHWRLPARGQVPFLIAAGALFYAVDHPPYLLLVATAAVATWALGNAVARADRSTRTRLVAFGVTGAIGLLAWFKYAGFAASLGVPWPAAWRPNASTHPPLGISFFVFEFVHYLIEIGRGGLAPGTLREFLLFVFFFPSLVCGPIKRFGDFRAQLATPRAFDLADCSAGLERIVIGLAKKLLVADVLGRGLDPIWAAPFTTPRGVLWLATYGYAAQIYFDFAGYSDIAIGSARLFGLRVPENFDRPYRQPNLTRFWRSWHMSLTSWITDYVYVPLGGNRHGAWRTAANRLLAMTVCGLWHGAAGHFVLWGAYHGLGLNLHQAYRARRGDPGDGGVGRLAATILTFHYVAFGWLLFRLDTVTALGVAARMLGMS